MHKLTHAPLPGWDDIAVAIRESVKPIKDKRLAENMLAEPWLRSGERGFWFSRSAWSLYSIAQFRRRVVDRECIHVWLPGYFCNISLAPLRALNVKLSFYPLLPDGKPDIAACYFMLEQGGPDLFLTVHYFGEPTPVGELVNLVENSGAWLIEDATHVLRPGSGIGEYGDFVLYSPHKFLPIPDGALLLVRENSTGNITDTMLERFDFQRLYRSITNSTGSGVWAAYNWLAKRLLQKMGIRPSRPIKKSFFNDNYAMSAIQVHHSQMSLLSERLLFAVLGSIDGEAKIRKENQIEWTKGLKENEVIGAAITPLSGGEAPYLAGFSCCNMDDAERVYRCLNKVNFPVTTWPDLPPEVLADIARHKVSIALRKTRFFLPVHRSIDPTLIPSVIGSIIPDGDCLIV